ncbi:MAG: NAD(P)-dependent oxidoreductase [Proteobacteria bacterium]|nr:NAD(P)-dependent oxidoreductase [Pseudomonadota bacterium]
MAKRAIFPDCPPDLAAAITPALQARVPGVELRVGDPPSLEETAALLQGYKAAMLYAVYVSEDLLAACPDLESVVYLSTGIETHADLAAIERRGISLRRMPSYADRAVAEHATALMFDAARQVARMNRVLRDGTWKQVMGLELGSRTLGVVGLGGIGREMVRIGHGLGMRVLAWTRSGVPDDLPCETRELDDLLAESDVVSLHLALRPETQGLIDAARLGRMKPGAILINTARSQIVEAEALVAALKSGQIGHAGLDVFDTEPLPQGDPLFTLPNVTLTTHAAWYTREAGDRLMDLGFAVLDEELRRIEARA